MKKSNQLIVITGGAGGIGTACAHTFKEHHLIITDYSQELVDKAVTNLKEQGYSASGIACDITNKEDIKKLVRFVTDHGTLKALVHTAGVSGAMQDLRKIYDIDLVATEILIKEFYEIATEGSVAVLLSSMMAHTVPPNDKYDTALRNPQEDGSFETVRPYVNDDSDIMYNFVKRGVQLLSLKYLNEYGAKKARIVTVSPGVIETEMALKAAQDHPERMEMIKKATPLQRNGTPEDVADLIYFLVSDNARFITGADFLVDGGVIHNIKNM